MQHLALRKFPDLKGVTAKMQMAKSRFHHISAPEHQFFNDDVAEFKP
jgi:hypothetical protein